MWHFVEASLAIAGCKIDMLHICTLGFSKRNIERMAQAIATGQIKRLRLLCSHYFKGTSRQIYDCMVGAFEAHPGRMEYRSLRTHAKLLLLSFEDDRKMTVESSANLRSCKNCENATLIGDPAVFSFHRGWVDALFERAKHDAPQ